MKTTRKENKKCPQLGRAVFTMLLLLFVPGLIQLLHAQKKRSGKPPVYARVFMHNPSAFARTEVVSIPWKTVQEAAAEIDTTVFSVLQVSTNKALPFQWEKAGTGAVQNLLVLVNLPANAEQQLLLVKQKSPRFGPMTYGRHVPERKDDFAWENNRVAFRMYGKALEATNENAYGIDVWSKRTDSLVIDDWYRNGDYHTDHGKGLDYYSVGFTLGAGDAAPYFNDSIWYRHNHHRWEMLDNGPLRTTFRLFYPAVDVRGKKLSATKTISLDAHSQLNRISIGYAFENDSLPVAIGIVRRAEPGVQLLDEQSGILAYWEPAHPSFGTTGVGVIIPAAMMRAKQDARHWLLTSMQAKEFTYYAGACWNKAGLFNNSGQWFEYLRLFGEKIKSPVLVRVQRPILPQ